MPCPYANLLGIPGEGVHAKRIFGLALNDIIATFVVAAITSYFFSIPYLHSLAVWFIAGEILHYGMGVNTALLEKIGIRSCNTF